MVSKYKVAVIPGDGVGPTIINVTLKILQFLIDVFSISMEFNIVEAGDNALKRFGIPLPESTLEILKRSHTCLKGPIGETAGRVIVPIRQKFNLYANVRPVISLPNVLGAAENVDLVIVRENTEGLYKGMEFEDPEGECVFTIRLITRKASMRIAEFAFDLAEKRRRKITIVHKANVMHSCRFFRDVCLEVAEKHPTVEIEEMYVDNAAYQLIRNPSRFDVILTTNMFGDILSDEAAALIGSLGLAPSGNIGENFSLFEPVHGSAPDIKPEYANPIATILSAKMMLEYLCEKHRDEKLKKAAETLKKAVIKVLKEGRIRTPDIGGKSKTIEVAEAIIREIKI